MTRCVDKQCHDGPPLDCPCEPGTVPHEHSPGPRLTTSGLLCKRCTSKLEQRLAEVPARADQLRSVLAAGPGRRGEQRPTKGSPPVPLNVAAHDHLEHLVGTLTSWTLLVREERDLRGPSQQTPHALSAWLLSQLDWIVDQPWVDDLAEEMRDFSQVADGITRANPAWHRLEPPCPVLGCGAHELYRQDGDAQVTCAACGAVWDEQHYGWLARMAADDVSVTARQAADRLGIPAGTFRRWVSEGRVRQVGTVDGLARYRTEDVDRMREDGAA